ncbi:MAG: LacI family DNA-binding transcriptional regulator [Planctomycetota bacterium]|nr:LacI family DNA-binding transcriptional regulator [Planctomycetota bacterium]
MAARVTLADIARASGVSRFTVARILKGETKGKWAVSAERIAEIKALAEKMGYRVNSAARATATGRFDAAALLTPNEGGDYLPIGVVRALVSHLAEHDQHLVIERLPRDQLGEEDRLPKLLRELSVDGFFLSHATDLPPALLHLIREGGGVPAVWLNAPERFDAVHPDDEGAAYQAVHRMYQTGRRRIAYQPPLYGPPLIRYTGDTRTLAGWDVIDPKKERHYSQSARESGYLRACAELGVAPQVFTPLPRPFADAVQAAEATMAAHTFDAVLAFGDPAPQIWRLAAARSGRRLPEDLALATFAWEHFDLAAEGLSGMVLETWHYARSAVDLLQAKLAEPTVRQPCAVVPWVWFDGGSV